MTKSRSQKPVDNRHNPSSSYLGSFPFFVLSAWPTRSMPNGGYANTFDSTFAPKYWLQESQTTPTSSVRSSFPRDSGIGCSTRVNADSSLVRQKRQSQRCWRTRGFLRSLYHNSFPI